MFTPVFSPAQLHAAGAAGVRIHPGYTHQRLRGIDTQVGKIVRKDGLAIQYDIGQSAGNYATSRKNDATWFKEQMVRNQTVQIAYQKDKELVVTFTMGPANSVATPKNEDDLAEILLILLTYSPE